MFEEGVKTFQQCLGEVLKRVQHLSREVLKQVCEQRFNVNPRALECYQTVVIHACTCHPTACVQRGDEGG